MTPKYQPQIHAKDVDFDDPDDHKALQASLDELNIDHVEDTDGNVYKLHGKLNKKSARIHTTNSTDPQRIKFTSIKSFGYLEGEEKGAPTPEVTESAPAHAERAHALLSASSAHRWLNCHPAPLLEEQHPDSESDAAAEGTEAHELAEYLLRSAQGEDITEPTKGRFFCEEMVEHAQAYAEFVTTTLNEGTTGAFLAVEQRLDFSHIVPDGFGTGDALIVDNGILTVIDFKYGKGVEVSAVDNPQMQLYALGALHQFGMIYDIHQVRMIIFQPRLHNISVAEKTVAELVEWAETVVKPAAQQATTGEGELNAGSWCQFCRHAPACTAIAKQHFDIVPTKGDMVPTAPEPSTLTDEQIAKIVLHAGELKKWLTAVEKYALDQANSGHAYTGLKLVEGRSVRKYADEDAVAAAVQEAGYNPYEKKLHGLTAMKKLLGAAQFKQLVEPHLHKPEGKPTLAPESDKRPALAVSAPENVFEAIA